ncbi:MAG TPA: hypothetical protein DCE76_02700 [Anaerolineaceae bacterium]|nr:hypothetical protein [Anaerolineaceae bacterium]
MTRRIFLTLLLAVGILLVGCNTKNLSAQTKECVAFLREASSLHAKIQIKLADVSSHEETINFLGFPQDAKITNYFWIEKQKKWLIEVLSQDNSDIYLFNWDGTGMYNLTNSSNLFETDFQVSPDQRLIAYSVSDGSLNTYIEIFDLDHNKKNQLGQEHYLERAPLWLDNHNLIIESSKLGSPNIFKVDINTKEWTNISNGPGIDTGASLSNQTQIMSFLSDRLGGWQVFIYDFQEQKITEPVGVNKQVSSVSISPNGKFLIMNIIENTNRNSVVLYNIENQIQTTIVRLENPILNFQWSLDSKKILFNILQKQNYDIFMFDIVTNELTNLTNSATNEFGARWIYINDDNKLLRFLETRQ